MIKTFLLGIVVAVLLVGCVSATVQPWCGSQNIYFSHPLVGDIPGYEGLKIYPDGVANVDESVTVKDTLGQVLIDSYVSESGLPDAVSLRAGLWRFRTFHYVSLASGATTFNFSVFKRTATGSESLILSTVTTDIDSLTPTEHLTSYVTQTDTTLAQTDRIVIKVYAKTDHSSNVVAHFLYEGSTNTSHVASPLFVCAPTASASDVGGEATGAALGLTAGIIGAIVISRRKS
jgi:hypothetical protein